LDRLSCPVISSGGGAGLKEKRGGSQQTLHLFQSVRGEGERKGGGGTVDRKRKEDYKNYILFSSLEKERNISPLSGGGEEKRRESWAITLFWGQRRGVSVQLRRGKEESQHPNPLTD